MGKKWERFKKTVKRIGETAEHARREIVEGYGKVQAGAREAERQGIFTEVGSYIMGGGVPKPEELPAKPQIRISLPENAIIDVNQHREIGGAEKSLLLNKYPAMRVCQVEGHQWHRGRCARCGVPLSIFEKNRKRTQPKPYNIWE